jgi:hypothetical protein
MAFEHLHDPNLLPRLRAYWAAEADSLVGYDDSVEDTEPVEQVK